VIAYNRYSDNVERLVTRYEIFMEEFSSINIKLNMSAKTKLNLATKRVWLYNTNEVNKYIEIVGSSNPRVYKR